MALLQEQDQEAIRERLKDMPGPVKLVNFTQTLDGEYCLETTELMKEIAELSDQLSVEVFNFLIDKEAVEQYGIERTPATVIEGVKDYGIRFYGFPGGYEFSAFLADILDVSKGDSGLSPETKARLGTLSTPIHLRVFSTPT